MTYKIRTIRAYKVNEVAIFEVEAPSQAVALEKIKHGDGEEVDCWETYQSQPKFTDIKDWEVERL